MPVFGVRPRSANAGRAGNAQDACRGPSEPEPDVAGLAGYGWPMTDATPSSRAEAWRARGAHISWSPAGECAAPVNVFHIELGDADAPVLALVHGFPTCSIDWFEVAERLSRRYRVCMLDFPGFGFSDKPRGWGYSLRRDAELLDHYLTQIVGARSVVMVAHDRGDSVALIHAANGAAGRAHAAVEH